MKVREESTNQKVWRYFFVLALGFGLILCVMRLPNKSVLNGINQEINQIDKQITKDTKVIKENSPANEEKNFDLIKAEKKAQLNIYSGVTFALGHAKNKKEYDEARPQLKKFIGEDMTNKLYGYNGSREDVVNNPKNFKFNLIGEKTQAQITFKPVTDIHFSQINVVATYYGHEEGKVKKYRSLLIFNYDLAKGKVVDSKIVNFSDPNLSGNE